MARVVVVNDDQDLLDTLRACLEAFGHEVATTFIAAEAIALAYDFRPDVAIVDWHIGDARGDDVVRALRADPMLSKLPVLLLSSAADEEEIAQLARAAGVDRILSKPIAVDELIREIEQLADHAPKTPAGADRPGSPGRGNA
jgi:two-component system phosphate regulon response regulator PhoB